ncbi:MAG: hypothetical protein GX070_08575 [Alcaligenaceae bacterium]|nr:hypothetical protein [Alcaligenaceae bacterium]
MARRLIIDTNLLLLLVIGAVEGGRHIHNSKRLGAYDITDYDAVLACMKKYKEVCITPYIAAEVSNLIDLDGHAGVLAYGIARELFSCFKEIDTIINDDCEPDYFLRFGITDSSLIRLAPGFDILTNDKRMLDMLFAASPNTIIPYEFIKQVYLN